MKVNRKTTIYCSFIKLTNGIYKVCKLTYKSVLCSFEVDEAVPMSTNTLKPSQCLATRNVSDSRGNMTWHVSLTSIGSISRFTRAVVRDRDDWPSFGSEGEGFKISAGSSIWTLRILRLLVKLPSPVWRKCKSHWTRKTYSKIMSSCTFLHTGCK